MPEISNSVECCFECNSVEWENNDAIIGTAIFLSIKQIGTWDFFDADFLLLNFRVIFNDSVSKLSSQIIKKL